MFVLPREIWFWYLSGFVLHRRIQRPENDIVPHRIPYTLFGYCYLLCRNLLDREQVSAHPILSGSVHRFNPLAIDGGGPCFLSFFLSSRSRTRVQGHAGTTAVAPGRTGSDWRLTKMILIIFVSFIVCYLPTAIIKIVDKKVERAGKCWSPFLWLIMIRIFYDK